MVLQYCSSLQTVTTTIYIFRAAENPPAHFRLRRKYALKIWAQKRRCAASRTLLPATCAPRAISHCFARHRATAPPFLDPAYLCFRQQFGCSGGETLEHVMDA